MSNDTNQPWEDAPAHYKSTDAEVLGLWEATQQRFRDWQQAKDAWGEQFPEHEVIALQRSDRVWVSGVQGDRAPGAGWRKTRKETESGTLLVWVPDKRTKAGKAHAAAIKELSCEHMRTIPGMPDVCVVGNRWHHPGMLVHDGTAYVWWSCSFAEVEADSTRGWSKTQFDAAKWERIKRSEFYAADESYREAKSLVSKAAS